MHSLYVCVSADADADDPLSRATLTRCSSLLFLLPPSLLPLPAALRSSPNLAAFQDVHEKSILTMTRDATPLLKISKGGRPGFRAFQLAPDLLSLTWQSKNKASSQTKIAIADMKELKLGQKTEKFKKSNRADLEALSFSILYLDRSEPGLVTNETLDLVCRDDAELVMWTTVLNTLIEGRTDLTAYLLAIQKRQIELAKEEQNDSSAAAAARGNDPLLRSAAAMSSAALGHYYQVQYGAAFYDIHSQSASLSKLRRLFNEQAGTTHRRDEARAAAAAASVPSVVLIPSKYRAWLRWGDRWVEVIDGESLHEALKDVHYIHSRTVAGVQSATGGWRIEVLFRAADAASPNTSPPLRPGVPAVRQQQLFTLQIRDMQPPVANRLDLYTNEEVSDIDVDDRVLVHAYGSPTSLLVSANGLLQDLLRQLEKNVALYDLKVTADSMQDGVQPLTVQINRYVWGQLVSHRRCPRADDFREAFLVASLVVPMYADALAELKGNADLYDRLQFLVADLLKLKDDDRWVWDVLHPRTAVAADLEQDAYFCMLYLPSLYFTRDEQLLLSQFPTPTGVEFAESVTAIVQNKFAELSASASSTGAHVCSSHDLAPLFRAVFSLDNNFYKASSFVKRHAEFEKKLKKAMQVRLKQGEAASTAPIHTKPAAASSPASSSSAAAPAPYLPADTPQLVKLQCLQAQLAQLALDGHSDAKIEKQVATLEKEVARMAKKK